jgi:opacity protein-like surface antigen
MKRILLLSALAAGCAASAAQLEQEAQQHRIQARASTSMSDYGRAAAEQEQANRLHEEAVKRALKEGRANDLAFVGR